MSKFLITISFILPFTVLLLSSIRIDFFGYFTIDLAKIGVFNFPLIWHVIPFFAAFFKFFFAFVVVSMIANEYSNRTLKQNLIDGLSKKEFLVSKFSFILVFTALSTFFIFIATLIIGLIHSSHNEISIVFTDVVYILAYFLKLLGFFSCCLFLAVLIKRSAFALGALLVLFILEIVFYLLIRFNWANEKIADLIMQFAPFTSMWNLINQPIQRVVMISNPNKTNLMYDYSVHWYELIIVIFWILIFMFGSYRLLLKRDL